jgi:dihydrofolate reductase
MRDYWEGIDTVLWGRKTWEVAARGQGGGYPGVRSFVFSRRLEKEPAGNVVLVQTDAAEFVGDLKQQEGKGICLMGGGELALSLFEADLIDEVGFNIHPVLLGSGIPLFHPMTRQIDLELKECRPFKNGCVYVLYEIKR